MLIPVVGGVMGLIIPLLAALLQSSPNTLWLMICLSVFELIIFNFVAPRLISQSVKIPSLLVIVAILIGWQLMGFWGFVFAVPDRGRGVLDRFCDPRTRRAPARTGRHARLPGDAA